MVFQHLNCFFRAVNIARQIPDGIQIIFVKGFAQLRPSGHNLLPPLDDAVDAVQYPLLSCLRRAHDAGGTLAVIIDDFIVKNHPAGIQKALIGKIFIINLMAFLKED